MIRKALDRINEDVRLKSKYDNFIGGDWVAPVDGEYFDNPTPINGELLCQVGRSRAADADLVLDAAHLAQPAWAATPAAQRALLLHKMADRMEEYKETLAYVETLDNGKPIRECLGADIPLAIDQLRYFAGCIRAQEGTLCEIDETTVAYHFHEALGVVVQIIPWNFPLLMAIWKIAPAVAAGNCVVLKPAEQTPMSIMVLMEIVGDILPPGVLNVVNGFGIEVGKPLASSPRVAKVAFTGETSTGRQIMQYASENIIPVTLELGGKSPNLFFEDVMREDDAFLNKCLEGFAMFALNQGEVCTCPSRAFVQRSIYDEFMERAVERVKKIKVGNPLELTTMVGAQTSSAQLEKICSYIEIGLNEGAELKTGGSRITPDECLDGGYYMEPTIFSGSNDMRIFQEEIFGPVLSVAPFEDECEALVLANQTDFGLGAGVWTRDVNGSYRMAKGIQAGRVWANCYHLYPAHAAFGGYKKSGFGRENHKMVLEHYQQTKNVIANYDPTAMGFF